MLMDEMSRQRLFGLCDPQLFVLKRISLINSAHLDPHQERPMWESRKPER
jgi:hypothetical protein